VALEGFAEKSATALVGAIAKARKTEAPRLLLGLGIPEVGEAVARDLARQFGSVETVRAASSDELQEVAGIGPKMAEQIATLATAAAILFWNHVEVPLDDATAVSPQPGAWIPPMASTSRKGSPTRNRFAK